MIWPSANRLFFNFINKIPGALAKKILLLKPLPGGDYRQMGNQEKQDSFDLSFVNTEATT
jgi:hypothetical protein